MGPGWLAAREGAKINFQHSRLGPASQDVARRPGATAAFADERCVKLLRPGLGPRTKAAGPEAIVQARRVAARQFVEREVGPRRARLLRCPASEVASRAGARLGAQPSVSTKRLRRSSASSHWRAIASRWLRAAPSGRRSSCQTVSRPERSLCASPAASSTRKCFVTAWRLMVLPAVKLDSDSGPFWLSRETRTRRCRSPSAAKTGADAVERVMARALAGQVLRDQAELRLPPALVVGECLGSLF